MAPPKPAKNRRQRQPITTTLRNICESYPPNTCLRELLQNADDARATEVEYVLDTRTYTDGPLLHSELAQYHGPALLARNNSVFTEDDLDSLSSVGDSGKRFDPATTGKFGQGFNSVYHWTDGPWVYSRNFLLMLDPHERWSKEFEAGGPTWDVIQTQDSPEIQNHLKTFAAFDVKPGKELNETIIRIPLRTVSQAVSSKIVKREAVIQDIKQILERFSVDMQEGGLLFLKHIRKVTVRVDNTILSVAQVLDDDPHHARSRNALSDDFLQLYSSPGQKGLDKLTRIFETNVCCISGALSWTEKYLVQHSFEASCGDLQLDTWAKDLKLFPWVAVAAPIRGQRSTFVGKLFSTLSLHITTQQPLHIHGLFAIAPDRARLAFDDMAIKWNTYMFSTCVTSAWVDLLEHRKSKSVAEERFDLWPRAYITYRAEDLWTGLKYWLVDKVVRNQHAVWNSTNGSCVSFQQALYAPENVDSARYKAAWTAIGLPGVILEQSLFEILHNRAELAFILLPILTPEAVRHHLRIGRDIPHEVAANILEYCLSDAMASTDYDTTRTVCSRLYDIRFWPMLNGDLEAITNSHKALLPRSDSEMHLFRHSRPSKTLKLVQMTPKVREFMLSRVVCTDTIARFRTLEDLAVDWPAMYHGTDRANDTAVVASQDEAQDLLLRDIWTWICERLKNQDEDMPPSMRTLWLVPISGARIRRLAPGKDAMLALLIEKGEPLADLLSEIGTQNTHIKAALLNSQLVTNEVVKYLRGVAVTRPYLRLAVQGDLVTLVEWLVACKDSLQVISDNHKKQLLKYLAMMVRKQRSRPILSNLAQKMRQLPLYAKSVGFPPYKQRAIQRCALIEGQRSYEIPEGFPSLPDLEGVSFYDLSDNEEKYLVQELALLQTITTDALLQRHLLPWVVKLSEDSMKAVKAAAIDWIMEKSLSSSEIWKALVKSHPLVPIPSGTSSQKYRCLKDVIDLESAYKHLYFDEEEVFPSRAFFEKHKDALRTCGICSGVDSPTLPLDRARAFARQSADDTMVQKARCLFTVPICAHLPSDAIQEIRSTKWIPAKSPAGKLRMYAPSQCRGIGEHDLVDQVWGTATLFLPHDWKKVLGWDEDVPGEVLLNQLDRCIEQRDVTKIDRLLPHFGPHEFLALSEKPCILGTHGTYMLPHEVFNPGNALKLAPMSPYIDRVDRSFASKHAKLLTTLEVKANPSVQDLQKVQSALHSSTTSQLDGVGLVVAIASLEVATQLRYDPKQFLVPDTTAVLRNLADVVYGERIVTGKMAEFNFAHPTVSVDLLRRLGVETSYERAIRLEIEIEDEDEDEYTPREQLTNIICDTLGRYPIDTAFNEFLANADDAGANQICWTIDECTDGPFATQSLLTPDLKSLQGPALMVYNDSVFSETDFAGFKEIGQGGKRDDATTTGMFGRGALTMYHFTDVPTLISGGYYLILDPQQERLSRNKHFKRKAGIKISLSTARRLASDQLAPFGGMHGYEIGLDYYEGTIFRFPFRETAAKTCLRDHDDHIDHSTTRTLLDAYLATARLSLLFLRSVNSIRVQIRGNETPVWFVSASRPEGLEDEVFHNVIVSTLTENQKLRHDLWRIGLMDIDSSPADIPKVGKGASKITECGIAACIQRNQLNRPGFESKLIYNTSSTKPGEEAHEQRVFCKLPTNSTSNLPVSFHASFAITGDRKTIAFEGQDHLAMWNRWLLTECVADFYIEYLKDAAPRYGSSAFDLWPKTSLNEPFNLSSVVADAFWSKIMRGKHRYDQLYPFLHVENANNEFGKTNLKRPMARGRRVLYETTTVEKANFDFLTQLDSAALQPLFRRLRLNLVRPPFRLSREIKLAARDLDLIELGSDFLATIFKKDDVCQTLEKYLNELHDEDARSAFYCVFLKTVTPRIADGDTAALKVLDGCRIIPRPQLNLRLGHLVLNPPQGTMVHLLANGEEEGLFSFAHDWMVNTKLFEPSNMHIESSKLPIRNPIKDIMKARSNIRDLGLQDIGLMLSRPDSPTKGDTSTDWYDEWLIKLWNYLNVKFRVMRSAAPGAAVEDFLTKAGLLDQPIYKIAGAQPCRYITPRFFTSASYIVYPEVEQQRQLCAVVSGLGCVDPLYVPIPLADTETSLDAQASFTRFILALSEIERATGGDIKTALDGTLTYKTRITLQNLIVHFLNHSGPLSSTTIYTLLRSLPVWPRVARLALEPISSHIAVKDASFCKHSTLFFPWVQNLELFTDPELANKHEIPLRKLGAKFIEVKEFWWYIQRSLPSQVDDVEPRHQLMQLLQYLNKYEVTTSERIAPNGLGRLCQPSSLFDHDDPIYREAFATERDVRFLHTDFRGLRVFFVRNGLKARTSGNVMSHGDFLQCALAVHKRSTSSVSSVEYDLPASTVASYLEYDTLHFRQWPASTWEQISSMRIFRVKRSLLDQPTYRQARMQFISQEQHHCSLDEVARITDIRICWSQSKFLDNPPTSYVFDRQSKGGRPSLNIVYLQLQFLVGMHNEVSQTDISEYLKDVQACYNHLQNESSAAKDLPGIKTASIWFNIDSTETEKISKDHLEGKLLPACHLCFDAPFDQPLTIRTRKFLVPYEKLLGSLGCTAIVQPPPLPPRAVPQHGPFCLGATMNDLRHGNELIDVFFEAEGVRLPAHRIVLAAVSDFCKVHFTGNWGQITGHQQVIAFNFGLERLATLSDMLDFAYGIDFSGPPLKDPEDTQEIADKLDGMLDLLVCADSWQMLRLRDQVEDFITGRANAKTYRRADNVIYIKEVAKRANAVRLVMSCDDYIRENPEIMARLA
ncbi:MAG: hypothetical protein Q9217_005473 [Psora testacea]